MKRILILFFLIIFSSASAQVPGYMGKRFMIGIGTAVSPSFNLFGKLDDPESTYLGPTGTTAFNMDYTYSQRRILSISMRYLTRKAESETYINPYLRGTQIEKLNLINYSIGIKRFGRKEIAPIGFYTKWEAYFINGWINYKAYSDLDRSTYNALNEFPGGKIKFTGAAGAYSVGKQRVFDDKILVDFGVRGTLMAIFYVTNGSYHEKQLARNATDPIDALPVFNLFVNIGFLAF